MYLQANFTKKKLKQKKNKGEKEEACLLNFCSVKELN
jgi:hypothetical protein